MSKRPMLKLECNMLGVPGLPNAGNGLGISCSSVQAMLDVARCGQGIVANAATDNGALSLYKDTGGNYRGMLMRYWRTVASLECPWYETDAMAGWIEKALAFCETGTDCPEDLIIKEETP